jgi:spectinomycin phosphotransferase
MVEMFDLEWRLDEIAQYAAWFAAPHAGTADDRIALGGLLGELDRPDWRPPG